MMKKMTSRKGAARGTVAAVTTAAALATAGPAAVLTTAAVLSVAAPRSAQAQVPFRVMRPENGATVRETVRIQMSRRALEQANIRYLAVSIDDKFREALAVLPSPASGKVVRTDTMEVTPTTVSVLWNTKMTGTDSTAAAAAASGTGGTTTPGASVTQGVPDGQHTIEIVAEDASGKRLGAQTLTLNVNNRGGMEVPSEGVPLSYHFQVGDTTKYHEVASVEYIGERQASPMSQTRGYNSPGYNGGGGGAGMPGAPMGGEGGGPPSYAGGRGGYGGRGGGPPAGYGGGRGGGPPAGYGGGGPGGGPPAGYGGRGGGPPSYGGGGGSFGAPGGGYSPSPDQSGPFVVPVQNVRADFERNTEDNLGGGLYFIRDKALDGTIISGNGAAARLEDVYNFKSRYRTVLTSGKVKDNGLANASRPGAYVALAIPDMGGGRRRVGQTWRTQTPVSLEWATLDKPPLVFATNTLEGLEWENGYQTARIKQTFNGRADVPIYGGAGVMRQANVKMDRTIWFAYKAGKIIRMETDTEVDGKAPADVLSAMVPAAGVGGGGGGFGEAGGFPGGGLGGPGGFPGAPGGPPGDLPGGGVGGPGFGAMAQQQEAQRVPAKFHATSTVTLVIPGRR